MTREQAQAQTLLESSILKAFAEGKTIQFDITDGNGEWIEVFEVSTQALQSSPERYRIKPEPREFWVVPRSRGYGQVDDGFVFKTLANAEAFVAREYGGVNPESIIKTLEVL